MVYPPYPKLLLLTLQPSLRRRLVRIVGPTVEFSHGQVIAAPAVGVNGNAAGPPPTEPTASAASPPTEATSMHRTATLDPYVTRRCHSYAYMRVQRWEAVRVRLTPR